jgi:hypothetical protein
MEELIFLIVLIVWPLVVMVFLTVVIGFRERRYRFSLRVMLVAMTLIAVWLGIVMARYHTRR